MNQNIIVVDDFYTNPDEIRNIALNSNYPEPETEYTYPGKNSEDSYYNQEIHFNFEKLINQKLKPADRNGYFRISLENDSHKQDIHVDPSWEWGAVVYLSNPKDCVNEGGTSFWRHNTLNIEMCPKTDKEAQNYGFSSYEEARGSFVYDDGQDRSKWTRYFLCPMKYNRMVIFRTYLWHSHNYNFGTNLENGRLVQLFFFR